MHPHHAMSRLITAIALCAGAIAPLSAQTTIQLEGIVRSETGEAVANAQVRALNPATNESRGGITGETGQFRILGLAPGRYQVDVRAIGYQPAVQVVELLVGQRANLVFNLQRGAAELGPVEVVAALPTTVEVQRTSVSSPVVRAQIENLPTNDRNVMTLAATTPGIKSFSPQAGRSLPSAGSVPDLRFINFYLDGVELKSLFNGNLVGIPQTGAPLPQESIQEFRVFLNPYDAEYSHAGAYVLSAVTNRGTNRTQGSAFGFLQNKDMVARNAFQTATPDYNRQQVGVNVRGPIQRDRLFYAVNYEATNTNNFLDVVPGRPASDPGIWDQYRGSFKAPNLNHTGFGRITYTPSERHTVDGFWALRYMTGESFFGGIIAREGGIDQTYLINIGQLRHRYLPTPRFMNELSLQLVNWHHDEGQLVPGPQRDYPSIVLGRATFPLELNEMHLRVINRATYTVDDFFGSHALKAGVELSHVAADQFSPNFYLGQFRFPQDASTTPDRATIGLGFPLGETGTGPARAELDGWITGVYLNDEWRLVPTFTLNLGLRYDAEINTLNNEFTVPWASDPALTSAPQLERFLNRGDRKNDLNNVSPRISFSWDPFGSNRTFVRGGFGIIYDRVPSFIGFQERLAASWRTYTITNPGTTDIETLRQRVISGQVTASPNIVLVKDKMNTPENRQLSIGLGHQLSPRVAVNLDLIHQDIRHLYTRLNANYLNTASGARTITPNYGDIILWGDFARARFDAAVVSVAYQRQRLLASLAYTLGHYRADYDAVTAPAFPFRSSYNMQRTSGDERHRVVLSEVATLPWGFQLSSIATLASPRPFGVILGQDLNRNNSLEDDFLARDGLADGDAAGLRTLRPSNAWRNWYRNVDVRVGKSLVRTQGAVASVTVEVFNVFDTNNTASYFGRMRDATGASLATFGQPNAAFAARRAQAGLKVEF